MTEIDTTITDLWHYATPRAAQRAGVDTPCSCRVDSYPAARHGRGKQYRLSWTVDGKPGGTKAFARKAKAEDHARKLIRGEVCASRTMGMDLLKDYAEAFLVRQYPNTRSRDRMRTNLTTHILPFFGEDIRLKEVTYLDIEDWKAHLRDTPSAKTGRPLAPKSVQHTYDLLNKVLKDAVKANKLDRNPAERTERPGVPAGAEIVPWEEETVLKLLAAIPDRHHSIALLAATCGLRKGETFGVSAQDIGEDRITVRHQLQWVDGKPVLVKPKWGSVRSVGLHPDTATSLRLHQQRYPTGIEMACSCGDPQHAGKKWTLLMADERGTPLVAWRWDKEVWHATLRAVGMDPTVPEATGLHQLRHHCASMWIDAGLTELQVRRWLGHRDASSTRIYTHLFEKAFTKTRGLLRGLYGGTSLLRAVQPDQAGQDAA